MLCLLLISSASWSQSSDTLTLRSEVSAVTVFLQGAQITRQARASLAKGTNYLVFPTLSPFLDPQSIQVKADGDITILSVNHQIDFLQKPEKSRLEKRIETVQDSLDYQKAMLAVVEEEEQVLKENRSIGGSQTGYTLPDLKACLLCRPAQSDQNRGVGYTESHKRLSANPHPASPAVERTQQQSNSQRKQHHRDGIV